MLASFFSLDRFRHYKVVHSEFIIPRLDLGFSTTASLLPVLATTGPGHDNSQVRNRPHRHEALPYNKQQLKFSIVNSNSNSNSSPNYDHSSMGKSQMALWKRHPSQPSFYIYLKFSQSHLAASIQPPKRSAQSIAQSCSLRD